MNSFHVQNSDQRNPLVELDKRNIKNESVALFILGIFLFVICIKLFSSSAFWVYIPLSLLYIGAGIFGFLAIYKDSPSFLTIFKALIYVIIVFNTALSLLAVFFIAYININPVDCSKSKSDSCGLGEAIVFLFEIVCIIVIIVCSLLIFFLIIILKHIKRYLQDKDTARYIYYA